MGSKPKDREVRDWAFLPPRPRLVGPDALLGVRRFFAALAGELVLSQMGRHSPKLLQFRRHGNSSSTCRPALAALNLACVAEMASFWTDELVRQTLVIAFTVIMRDEVLNGCPQRLLAEEDRDPGRTP